MNASFNVFMGLLTGLIAFMWIATMVYVFLRHRKDSPTKGLRPGVKEDMLPPTGRKPETTCSSEEETRARRT
jgi:hypothetical protein